jgi:hypothetical protein
MCAERQRRAAAVVWGLCAGLIGMYLVLFALIGVTRLARPLEELTYGESWLLDGARQVALDGRLYAPADQVPLMHTAYTPLYYLVVGELQRVVGDHGYAVGRGVSLAATVVGAAAFALSLHQVTAGSIPMALLGAGLLLTQNVTMLLWASQERVDALALALTLIGMALVTARRTSSAALIFVLALFTKQSYLAAPLATALVLWRCKTELWRFLAVFVAASCVLAGLVQWLTGGWFLWHAVTANTNEADLSTFATLAGSFFQFNGLPVLAALASLALPAAPAERPWRIYFVVSLLTLPSIAKIGASSNYWLEATAATAAMIAIAAHRLAAWPTAHLVAPTIVASSLLVAVPAYQATAVEVAASLGESLRPAVPRYLSLVSDSGTLPYRVDATFIERIAREPGALLTDNSGLAVAAGKPIEFEFQIFQLLAVEGHWSQQPILDAIGAREFALVALMHPLDGPTEGTRLTPAVRRALLDAYAPAGSEAGFWLYRPRP